MLEIKNLEKAYFNNQQTVRVFDNFNLSVNDGEFITIFGPNGCGKTTLLNIIAGTLKLDSGEINFNDRPINSLRIGFVFQDYRNSLFPWLKIKDNISFPLKLKNVDRKIREKEVGEMCKRFGCNFNLESFSYELSGGQQQFISLLRGLIINPELYLLDEPFSSLDYQTTLLMLEKLSEIWQKTKITTLFVSHEIDEAIFLSQRIVLLSNKPSSIVKIFDNPLPYPRKISLLGSPEFAKLKKEILAIYSQEILDANVRSSVS